MAKSPISRPRTKTAAAADRRAVEGLVRAAQAYATSSQAVGERVGRIGTVNSKLEERHGKAAAAFNRAAARLRDRLPPEGE